MCEDCPSEVADISVRLQHEIQQFMEAKNEPLAIYKISHSVCNTLPVYACDLNPLVITTLSKMIENGIVIYDSNGYRLRDRLETSQKMSNIESAGNCNLPIKKEEKIEKARPKRLPANRKRKRQCSCCDYGM